MNVHLKDFYAEVTGVARSRDKMIADLAEWKIPTTLRGMGNGARKHIGVDLSHLEEAKAKWELAKVTALPPRQPARPRVEELQKLDEILTRIRGLEVAINALMKLAKS